MKCHEPGPPLLFTMIMKQMVMPRTTSSESSLRKVAGAAGDWAEGSEVAEVVIAIAVSVRLGLPLSYALGASFAKCGKYSSAKSSYHRQSLQSTKLLLYSLRNQFGKRRAQFFNTSSSLRTRLAILRADTYYPQ